MFPFDQNNQQVYQQYAQAHDSGDYSGIDPDQAMGHVQQFMQNAPPEMQQQVYEQHFSQMPQEQREQFAQQMPPEYGANPNDPRQMAQGFQQMGQQQPGMLQQLMGGAGGLMGGSGGGAGGLGGLMGGAGGGLGGMMGGAGGGGGLGSLVGLIAKQVMSNRGGGL